jgi:hypothetical protein
MTKIRRPVPRAEKVSVSDLLELIPGELIEQLAADLHADKWVKKLKAGALFKLVLFSLLNSERLSLRVMEENFEDPFFRALAPALAADEVTWTGIRERLMKLNSAFCRRLYEAVYERAQQLYGEKTLAGYHIKRYDSTMVATFSHLLEGMKVGNTAKGKTQVKLTTELTDDFLIQMHFHKDQAHLSEETAMKEAILKSAHTPQDISVFDKGLKSRKTFGQLDGEGILFVGRLNGEPRYELLHPHWQDDGMCDTGELEFVQDSAVHLYESGTETLQRKLRMVQFRLKRDGQVLSFVTNLWDVPAEVVADIYRRRWDIEVLFRFMKQEMNLTHFVCNDTNAIQAMLYFTMIAAMLVLIYKKRNGIKSYKMAKIQFFKELFYTVMLEALESNDGVEWLKQTVKKFIQRE